MFGFICESRKDILVAPRALEPPIDRVLVSNLPEPIHIPATQDSRRLVDNLPIGDLEAPIGQVGTDEIDGMAPSGHITTINNIGIDLELLAGDARGQAGHLFTRIIRGGGTFDYHRDGRTDRQVEALAVSIIGLDGSLSSHGAEQARRMDRLVVLQQLAHLAVFQSIKAVHHNTTDAVAAYGTFRELVPNFGPRDVKYAILCALIHDYGEAKLGKDIPFELKTNPAYVALEAAACVTLATELHFPKGSPHLVEALDKRVREEAPGRIAADGHQPDISYYLDPREITTAIYGTEKLDHGTLARAEAFVSAVERIEYVLSGIRAFEAVEHNFQGARDDRVLRQNLLRLGVSTFYNSLDEVAKASEKFVMAYDFLAQNSATIGRYIDIVINDIDKRSKDQLGKTGGFFGSDPFSNYTQDGNRADIITAQEARQKFLAQAKFWKKWQTKQHMGRLLWETYFGTEHPLTRDNPDVSFLQYTANSPGAAGYIAVRKPLRDMWGVGLDDKSRRDHVAKTYGVMSGKE